MSKPCSSMRHESPGPNPRPLGFCRGSGPGGAGRFQAVYRRFIFAAYGTSWEHPWWSSWPTIPTSGRNPSRKWFWPGNRPGLTMPRPRRPETRDDLLHRAGLAAIRELGPSYGSDPEGWRWGRMHRLTLVSPIRREGFAAALLGGGSHAMGGSQETLYRASYDYNHPHDVTLSASLRMVMDLGDPDKIMAVLPAVSPTPLRPSQQGPGGTLHERGSALLVVQRTGKSGKTPGRPCACPETQGEASDSTRRGNGTLRPAMTIGR